ncbi:MAG TPA: ribonuclease HII [Firmicutes bacterium]|nr:ribonuclease HII [Bacillota bacterium]
MKKEKKDLVNKKSLNNKKMGKTSDDRDLLKYEKELYDQGITLIAGVDEAGRGPLVGPVVAGCVILPVNYDLPGLDDSKKLSEKKREQLYDIIMKEAISVGVGIVDAKTIDEINILEASRLAMKLAIENMPVKPEYVLSDAMKLDNITIPYKDIIHGDALSLSIAAGSVIAKVTRDRMMIEYDRLHPEYGFAKHKGYPTKAHLQNMEKYGVLDEYRFTYKPVSDLIKKMNGSD